MRVKKKLNDEKQFEKEIIQMIKIETWIMSI